jgi:ERCC4-type nuclease
MHIIIDCRENKLIELFSPEAIKVESLKIGDIVFRNDKGEDIVIIERKSVADLAASISDGRYNEQSYRLNACDTTNHNIIYLIEGDIRAQTKFSRITPDILYSSITSICLYKGFSLFATHDLQETFKVIQCMFKKVCKNIDDGKHLYTANIPAPSATCGEYIDVMKNAKKTNITSGNIAEIMLSQIPSVSKNIAKVVMEEYRTLANLMDAITQKDEKLDMLKMKDSKGKERRISKTAIENIKTYLI